MVRIRTNQFWNAPATMAPVRRPALSPWATAAAAATRHKTITSLNSISFKFSQSWKWPVPVCRLQQTDGWLPERGPIYRSNDPTQISKAGKITEVLDLCLPAKLSCSLLGASSHGQWPVRHTEEASPPRAKTTALEHCQN